MQGSSPSKLQIIGTINSDVEAYLHEKFKEIRIRREWFSPTDSLVEFILDNCSNKNNSFEKISLRKDVEHYFSVDFNRSSRHGRAFLFGWCAKNMKLEENWEHNCGDDGCSCEMCCVRRAINFLCDASIKEFAICKEKNAEMRTVLCSVSSLDKMRLYKLIDACWEFDYAGFHLDGFCNDRGDLTSLNLWSLCLNERAS